MNLINLSKKTNSGKKTLPALFYKQCHGPALKAACNPLLGLAQEENKSSDLLCDFLTDCYRPSVKENSLKPDLY